MKHTTSLPTTFVHEEESQNHQAGILSASGAYRAAGAVLRYVSMVTLGAEEISWVFRTFAMSGDLSMPLTAIDRNEVMSCYAMHNCHAT